MSAEAPTVAEETPAPNGDAFGATPGQPPVEAPEPAAEETPAAEVEAEAEAPWWAKYGETEEQARSKVEGMEHLMGKHAREVGELRQTVDQLRTPQQAQAQPQEEGERQLTREELEEWYEEEPLAATAYLNQLQIQEALGGFAEQFSPVVQTVNQQVATSTIEALKQEFGDETVHRHREALHARIANDEAWFADPQTRATRLREAVAALEFERLRNGGTTPPAPAARPTGAVTRTTHVEGGSEGQPATATEDVDPELAEMDAVRVTKRDPFGAR